MTRKPRQTAEARARDVGLSRSGYYRQIARDPNKRFAFDVFRHARPGAMKQATLKAYLNASVFIGIPPEVLKRNLQKTAQSAGSAIGRAAKKKHSNSKLKKALALHAAGQSWKSAAAAIGMSERGLRNLRKT